MTAVMERTDAAPVSPDVAGTLTELRATLAAQHAALAEQHRMLSALDARREQLDELIEDMLPVANAAMLMATRHLDAATGPAMRDRLHDATQAIARVRRAPAPGTFALLRRLRDPDVRMGLALALAVLEATGRAASVPPIDRAMSTTAQ